MARLTIDAGSAAGPASEETYARLESGDILYFPTNPIPLDESDRSFLLRQKQSEAFHKNISYRPAHDRLKGVDARDAADFARTHEVMRAFSRKAVGFVASFLPAYAP